MMAGSTINTAQRFIYPAFMQSGGLVETPTVWAKGGSSPPIRPVITAGPGLGGEVRNLIKTDCYDVLTEAAAYGSGCTRLN